MTLLCATVTKQGAILSQDSWIYQASTEGVRHAEASGGTTRDFIESAESLYFDGQERPSIDVLGNICKILPVPRLAMAVAGTGSFEFLLSFWVALAAVQALHFDDAKDLVQDQLRSLRDKLAVSNNAMVVCAGYDARRDCGFGYVYDAHEDFQRRSIEVGETMAPAPDPDDAEYPAIYELWQAASQGDKVNRLHRALFDQQQRAFRAGQLAPGVAVGGFLHQVWAHAGGVNFSMAT